MTAAAPDAPPAPPPAPPRILAILCIRNEAPFLIDWLAHHRAAGVSDFLVFSNDCDDGSDAMLDRLAELGWLTHLRNPGPHPKGPQWAALQRAEDHPLMRAADWVIGLDIDEFVNVHVGDRSLPALISTLPEASAIALSWRLFGNDGHLARRPGLAVPAQFTRAAPPVMRWPWRAALFKTLFRNDGSYRRPGVHRPRAPDPARLADLRWFDGAGCRLPPAIHLAGVVLPPGQNRYGLAQINHYALGTIEDYLLKCDRGRANRDAPPFDLSYWVERNFCSDPDTTILALAARSAPLAAALRADATLAGLEAAAEAWRRARLLRLLAEEAWRALYVRLRITPPSQPLDPAAQAEVARLFAQATEDLI